MSARFHVTIPDGDGPMALRVARTFPGLPARFTLLASERRHGTHWSRFCEAEVVAPPEDEAALLARLMALPERPSNVLLPILTPAFRFVARHRDTLRRRYAIPPIASEASLALASDKWRLHERCRELGLPVLPSAPLSEAISTSGADALAFPLLIKPREGQGGHDFRRVDDLASLRASGEGIGAAEVSRHLVQPFVDGIDYSLSAWCEGGEIRCHTLWRAVSYGPQAFHIPECIRFVEHEGILAIGRDLLRALAWEGLCDVDFFVDRHSGEAWILEVNARFFLSVPAATLAGVPFTRIACERALSREVAWPVQRPEWFCERTGLRRALRQPEARRALLRRPLRRLSLGLFLRDPGPDVYRWMARLRHGGDGGDAGDAEPAGADGPPREGRWRLVLGALFLVAQLASIGYARFVPEKFFCWAPYDQHTRYTIEVAMDGRPLAPDAIAARYRYPQDGWEIREIANVLSIVRQYETTYGAGDGAEVTVTYRTNGHETQTWTWPPR